MNFIAIIKYSLLCFLNTFGYHTRKTLLRYIYNPMCFQYYFIWSHMKGLMDIVFNYNQKLINALFYTNCNYSSDFLHIKENSKKYYNRTEEELVSLLVIEIAFGWAEIYLYYLRARTRCSCFTPNIVKNFYFTFFTT